MSLKFRTGILSLTACLVAALASPAAEVVPTALRQLAALSSSPQTWPALHRYAQSQSDPEWRGWTYFLAGYSEFTAEHFTEAASDLRLAAETAFSWADFAVFYQASAASRAGNHLEASQILKNFALRFPQSYVHGQALELRTGALLEAQKPQDAIDILSATTGVRDRPALVLILAKAYQQTNRAAEAAHAFQDIYLCFPLSLQAKSAGSALEALREQMGTAYPIPTDEAQTGRVEIFFRNARYQDALKEFESLENAQPASPYVPRWQLGRARCLVRLRRGAEALELLFNHFAAPELEAQRLAVLAQIHIQQSDAAALTLDLSQLETQFSASPAYATALSAAGNFYYRQVNWPEAARNYQRLSELFPHSASAKEDDWRLAWCAYVLHNPGAPDAIHDYLMRYPDSPRAPAALYWLARTQEERGTEARALYTLLGKRFAHSYYTVEAAARLALPSTQSTTSDAAVGSLTATIAAALGSPSTAPGLACVSSASNSSVRVAQILQALGQSSLEQEYLKAAIDKNPSRPELRILLARADAAQDNQTGALFDALKAVPAYAHVEFSTLPEEVWEFLYPLPYSKLIERESGVNKLDPYLVMGLIRQESAFNPQALSSANARGLMQVLPETAAASKRASRVRSAGRRLYEPEYNVRFGCAYLAQLLKKFDNRPELAVAAYNAGDFRIRDWLSKGSFPDSLTFMESIPIPATRSYVELVLRDAEIYRQLKTGSPHFALCDESRTPHSPKVVVGTRRPSAKKKAKRAGAPSK